MEFAVHTAWLPRSFLFDVVSKIYVATDSSPVEMQSYELCSDMIDVVIDVSCIYGAGDGDSSTYAHPRALNPSGFACGTLVLTRRLRPWV